MSSKRNDADAPLPAYPWAPSPSASPRQSHVRIDIEEPLKIYEDDLLPQSGPTQLAPGASDAKRRKPSDATPVPNPAYGYRGPPNMTKKPGSTFSHKPIDTINSSAIADRVNPALRSKHTTYGKRDRALNGKLIGIQRHGGQQSYLERYPAAASRRELEASASPVKRRRIVNNHTSPTQAVEILDSEDEVLMDASPTQDTPATHNHSTFSSGSPRSVASWHSGTGVKSASQPTSEFTATDKMMQPKRTKRRRKDGSEPADDYNGSPFHAPTVDAGSLSHGHPLATTRGTQIPQHNDFEPAERGVHHSPQRTSRTRQLAGEKTSRFFSQNGAMRINESTAEVDDRIASANHGDLYVEKDLRQFRRAGGPATGIDEDPIEGSEDELSRPDAAELRKEQNHAARNGPVPKGCYTLNFFQTYASKSDQMQTMLRPTSNSKIYRITGRDVEGRVTTLHQLNLNGINKVYADDTSRMRLCGPKNFTGKACWYDLEFEDPTAFKKFRDECAFPECAPSSNKVIQRQSHMQDMFRIPLKVNDKVGKSAMVSDVQPAHHVHTEQKPSRPGLVDSLANKYRDITAATSSAAIASKTLPSISGQARPARATRARAPLYDEHLDSKDDVVKYSQATGLGKPWQHQLDYNISDRFLRRRRCTVNWDDLPRLDEEEFLNDSLVNFYLLYLYHNLKVDLDRVYFFNTYFFEALTKNTKRGSVINYDAVKSWTRRDDVFGYDYIVVPINESYHWYLAIICNVKNIVRMPVTEVPEADSQDLDQPNDNAQAFEAIAKTDSEPSAESHDQINGGLSAPEPPANSDVEPEDENLFEEERRLSLVDPEKETASEDLPPAAEQEPVVIDPITTAATEEQREETTATDPVSYQSKQQSKKKMKQKPAIPKRDPKKPIIMVLDSLGGVHSKAARALREWLEAEGQDKRGLAVELENRACYPKSPQIPMQINFSDCGLYVLSYAKKFFADPDEFKEKTLKGEWFSQEEWPDVDASKMRSDIRELVFNLYAEQHKLNKEAQRAKRASKSASAPTSPPPLDSEKSSFTVQHKTAETEVLNVPRSKAKPEPLAATSASRLSTPPAAGPRLASPFSLKAQANTCQPQSVDKTKEESLQATHTTARSPKVTAKMAPATVKPSPTKRPGSPEVRILASPPTNASAYVRYDGASEGSKQVQGSPDLTDPLQNAQSLNTKEKTGQSLSAKKAQTHPPSKVTRERQARSSPLQSRARSGSHNDPIPLDDSQDLDAPMQRESQSAKKPPPEIIELDRSQESVVVPGSHRLSPIREATHRTMIQDEDGLGADWRDLRESKKLSRAMKNPLKDAASPIRHRLTKQSQANSHSHPRRPATQRQVIDMMDSQDSVVPESPEQRRSSPPADVEMLD